MKILFPGLALVALFTGCSTQLESFATPQNIQVSVTVLSGLAYPKLSAKEKAIVHTFATDLLALSMGNITSTEITSLTPAIPASASPYLAPLITAAVADINLALVKLGSKNAAALSYVQAVANGFLSAGF